MAQYDDRAVAVLRDVDDERKADGGLQQGKGVCAAVCGVCEPTPGFIAGSPWVYRQRGAFRIYERTSGGSVASVRGDSSGAAKEKRIWNCHSVIGGRVSDRAPDRISENLQVPVLSADLKAHTYRIQALDPSGNLVWQS